MNITKQKETQIWRTNYWLPVLGWGWGFKEYKLLFIK